MKRTPGPPNPINYKPKLTSEHSHLHETHSGATKPYQLPVKIDLGALSPTQKHIQDGKNKFQSHMTMKMTTPTATGVSAAVAKPLNYIILHYIIFHHIILHYIIIYEYDMMKLL